MEDVNIMIHMKMSNGNIINDSRNKKTWAEIVRGNIFEHNRGGRTINDMDENVATVIFNCHSLSGKDYSSLLRTSKKIQKFIYFTLEMDLIMGKFNIESIIKKYGMYVLDYVVKNHCNIQDIEKERLALIKLAKEEYCKIFECFKYNDVMEIKIDKDIGIVKMLLIPKYKNEDKLQQYNYNISPPFNIGFFTSDRNVARLILKQTHHIHYSIYYSEPCIHRNIDSTPLKMFDKHLKNDEEIMKMVIQKYDNVNSALKFASEDLKKNMEIVSLAVEKDPFSLAHASKCLWYDFRPLVRRKFEDDFYAQQLQDYDSWALSYTQMMIEGLGDLRLKRELLEDRLIKTKLKLRGLTFGVFNQYDDDDLLCDVLCQLNKVKKEYDDECEKIANLDVFRCKWPRKYVTFVCDDGLVVKIKSFYDDQIMVDGSFFNEDGNLIRSDKYKVRVGVLNGNDEGRISDDEEFCNRWDISTLLDKLLEHGGGRMSVYKNRTRWISDYHDSVKLDFSVIEKSL